MLKEALVKLIKVKSIVTLVLTVAFVYLSVTKQIDTQNFMAIFTMIMGFYFGTQYEKKTPETPKEAEV